MTPTTLEKPLPDFGKGRTSPPSCIVLHYSAGFNAQGCYEVLKMRRLSAHYTIERNGDLWKHVADGDRCWHAGPASWAGVSNLNNFSLGAEIVNFGYAESPAGSRYVVTGTEEETDPNATLYYRMEAYNDKRIMVGTRSPCIEVPDHRFGKKGLLWATYPQKQLDSVFWLVNTWCRTYDIGPENVIGHEHVLSTKDDPGPAFPWQKLDAFLEASIGLSNITHPGKVPSLVKAVQSHCLRAGVLEGKKVDGEWGPKTQRSVEKMFESYSKLYGFENVTPAKDNAWQVASALKRVPGFKT